MILQLEALPCSRSDDPMTEGALKATVGRKPCGCTPCSALQGIRGPTAVVRLENSLDPELLENCCFMKFIISST
jgi:hypothetical protein